MSVGASHRGERPHRDVGTLQRLDAADEQQHRPVGRQLQRTPGTGAVAGGEERVLDRGGDHLDPPRRVAVEPAELALLLVAVHADGIGAADDLGLGALAQLGLAVAALGLHLGERVEGGDERQAALVLQPVGDQAAEPVVRVHDVGRELAVEMTPDAGGELVDDPRQVLLGQVVRTGGDVHDAVPGLDLHDLGQTRPVGAGERGAVDTQLRERRHEFADVHVHAATVTRPRLRQGRGVEGDHGHSSHGESKPYPTAGDSRPSGRRPPAHRPRDRRAPC
ncbi:unannotated protein [freshwater metagenome]|uniref:Unannotated protein n=1 Tax=freshwater metagenome TaxID=449393 RepID=A0A6J6CB40_9ZZZZ